MSDRGTTFLNETIRQLCLNHGIKHRLSSLYHPQTNGLVERFNRTLCQSLAKYVDLVQHDWDKYISAVLFAYRTMKQGSTRFEPFMLTYGRTAITPLDLNLQSESTETTDLEDQILRRAFSCIDQLEPKR